MNSFKTTLSGFHRGCGPTIALFTSPCPYCKKMQDFQRTVDDHWEWGDFKEKCMVTCEDYAHFEKYGINSLVPPSDEETSYLLRFIQSMLDGDEVSELSEADVDALRVRGDRLALVLNLEEAKIERARSAISRVKELLGE